MSLEKKKLFNNFLQNVQVYFLFPPRPKTWLIPLYIVCTQLKKMPNKIDNTSKQTVVVIYEKMFVRCLQ